MRDFILILITAIVTTGVAYIFKWFISSDNVVLTKYKIIFNYLDSTGINVQSFRDITFNLRFENKSNKKRVVTIERVNFCDGEILHGMHIHNHTLNPVLNIDEKKTQEIIFDATLDIKPDVGHSMVNSETIYVQIYFSVNGKERGKTIYGTSFSFNGIDYVYLK